MIEITREERERQSPAWWLECTGFWQLHDCLCALCYMCACVSLQQCCVTDCSLMSLFISVKPRAFLLPSLMSAHTHIPMFCGPSIVSSYCIDWQYDINLKLFCAQPLSANMALNEPKHSRDTSPQAQYHCCSHIGTYIQALNMLHWS